MVDHPRAEEEAQRDEESSGSAADGAVPEKGPGLEELKAATEAESGKEKKWGWDDPRRLGGEGAEVVGHMRSVLVLANASIQTTVAWPDAQAGRTGSPESTGDARWRGLRFPDRGEQRPPPLPVRDLDLDDPLPSYRERQERDLPAATMTTHPAPGRSST